MHSHNSYITILFIHFRQPAAMIGRTWHTVNYSHDVTVVSHFRPSLPHLRLTTIGHRLPCTTCLRTKCRPPSIRALTTILCVVHTLVMVITVWEMIRVNDGYISCWLQIQLIKVVITFHFVDLVLQTCRYPSSMINFWRWSFPPSFTDTGYCCEMGFSPLGFATIRQRTSHHGRYERLGAIHHHSHIRMDMGQWQ